MKQTRPFLLAVLAAACLFAAPRARAGSVCTDEPERCVERGASVPHAAVVVGATRATPPAAATVAAHRMPAVAAHKQAPAAKSAKPAPRPALSTPGMGMLLKMSAGSGGDVTWSPGRSVDNTGASWVL